MKRLDLGTEGNASERTPSTAKRFSALYRSTKGKGNAVETRRQLQTKLLMHILIVNIKY